MHLRTAVRARNKPQTYAQRCRFGTRIKLCVFITNLAGLEMDRSLKHHTHIHAELKMDGQRGRERKEGGRLTDLTLSLPV